MVRINRIMMPGRLMGWISFYLLLIYFLILPRNSPGYKEIAFRYNDRLSSLLIRGKRPVRIISKGRICWHYDNPHKRDLRMTHLVLFAQNRINEKDWSKTSSAVVWKDIVSTRIYYLVIRFQNEIRGLQSITAGKQSCLFPFRVRTDLLKDRIHLPIGLDVHCLQCRILEVLLELW